MKVLFDRGVPPRSVYIADTQPVHDGPCLLVAFTVRGGAAVNIVTFYDGLNANGIIVQVVTTVIAQGITMAFPDGILFDRGLFLDMGCRDSGTMVSYYPGSIDRPAVEVESE